MSWLYLPEQEVDYSQPNGNSVGERSAMSKKNRIASKSSKRGSKTAGSMRRRSGMMLEHSTAGRGVDAWILSLRASRASRSAEPEKCWLTATSAICGRIPFASLAKFSLNGFYWKTSQHSFPGLTDTLDRYSARWPKSGLMRGGDVYRLPRLERHTNGSAYSLWLTPTANDGRRGHTRLTSLDRVARGKTISLGAQVVTPELLPTPTASEMGSNTTGRRKGMTAKQRILNWPTPTVADSRNTRNSTAKRNKIPPTGVHLGNTLVDIVTMFPTPTKRDIAYTSMASKKKYQAGPTLREMALGDSGGMLNPDWEEWLMGWPIGWTGLRPLGTAKFQKWLRSFGNYWHNQR